VNDYVIYVHLLDLDKNKNIKKTTKNGGAFYASEQADYDFWTKRITEAEENLDGKTLQLARIMRMKAMMNFKSKETFALKLLDKINDKTIIFANTKEQAIRLSEHQFLSGNARNEENLALFNEDKIKTLSCVLQLSEGKNIKNLRNGVILHGYASNSKISQRLARMWRLSPDDVCTCHILCYKDTQDIAWVQSGLEDLNSEKIVYIDDYLSNAH
jgi:superfamily II DNA or RNA helicase